MNSTKLPDVHPHPEILDLLLSLARGASTSGDVFAKLCQIAASHLPSRSSKAQAMLLGNLISRITFSPDSQLPQVLQEADECWRTLLTDPVAEGAVEWATAALLVGTCLTLRNPDVENAERILYREQITRVLPLPPNAPFDEDKST